MHYDTGKSLHNVRGFFFFLIVPPALLSQWCDVELKGNNHVKVDFKELKRRLDARTVLDWLELGDRVEESPSNDVELIGYCPFCENQAKKSFSVNTEKKVFQTFCCKAKGSLLDLIQKVKGLETIRDAGEYANDRLYGQINQVVREVSKSSGQGTVDLEVYSPDGELLDTLTVSGPIRVTVVS